MLMNREKTLLTILLLTTLIVALFGLSAVAQVLPDEIWKAPYPDYAPWGIPDFDQRQKPEWTNPNPPIGTWSWCGPTAVANCLWWMDSRFEDPASPPPPEISDNFPLLLSYGPWDDHDPQNAPQFIEDLAWYMDTDGQRTGSPHCGTFWGDVVDGINQYLHVKALDKYFYVEAWEYMVLFEDIAYELWRCEDVILLLGFWQEQAPGMWVRLGGHYVTVEAANTVTNQLAVCDPIRDLSEAMGYGPPFVPYPHTYPHDPAVHDNATFVSYDVFNVTQSPSPGGVYGFEDYYPEDIIYDIAANGDVTGEYIPGPQIFTEIEAMIKVSPICVTLDGYKPPFNDYAQSGVPDFDQERIEWFVEQYTYCGPTAVANSLWWMDSRFEDPASPPPPEISDSFVMVTRYDIEWDDHDPQNAPQFIEDLAWYMDTDGQRTGSPHRGTIVFDMATGIEQYLKDRGLAYPDRSIFEVRLYEMPEFEFIEYEIERCEDVILLLGFYQEVEPYFYYERVGGHYVTAAGVWSEDWQIAFSDPYLDNAEAVGLGRVLPPHMGPHGSTVHDNATFVSHDTYNVGEPSPIPPPGGLCYLLDYPTQDPVMIGNFVGQNPNPIVPTFEWNPMLPIVAQVEFMVTISPVAGKEVFLGDANGDGFVSGWDLSRLSDAWMAQIGDVNFDPSADFNFDGFNSGWDLSTLSDQWMKAAPS